MIRLCVGHYHKSIVCKRNAEESLVALNTAGGSAASGKLLGQLSFAQPGFRAFQSRVMARGHARHVGFE